MCLSHGGRGRLDGELDQATARGVHGSRARPGLTIEIAI